MRKNLSVSSVVSEEDELPNSPEIYYKWSPFELQDNSKTLKPLI